MFCQCCTRPEDVELLTCFLMQLLQQSVLVGPHAAGGQHHSTPQTAIAASRLTQASTLTLVAERAG